MMYVNNYVKGHSWIPQICVEYLLFTVISPDVCIGITTVMEYIFPQYLSMITETDGNVTPTVRFFCFLKEYTVHCIAKNIGPHRAGSPTRRLPRAHTAPRLSGPRAGTPWVPFAQSSPGVGGEE